MNLTLVRFAYTEQRTLGWLIVGDLSSIISWKKGIGIFAALYGHAKRVVINTTFFRDLLQRLASRSKRSALIESLISRWNPKTVERPVIAVNLLALQGIAIRAWPHISKKPLKTIAPLVAHANAATAVISKTIGFGPKATDFSIAPSAVFARLCHGVRAVRASPNTPAALSAPEVCRKDCRSVAAITSAAKGSANALDHNELFVTRARANRLAARTSTRHGMARTKFLRFDGRFCAARTSTDPSGMRDAAFEFHCWSAAEDSQLPKHITDEIEFSHAANYIN